MKSLKLLKLKLIVLITLGLALLAIGPILASANPADPGHGAASISAGTFEGPGNFTFPNWLNIKRGLEL